MPLAGLQKSLDLALLQMVPCQCWGHPELLCFANELGGWTLDVQFLPEASEDLLRREPEQLRPRFLKILERNSTVAQRIGYNTQAIVYSANNPLGDTNWIPIRSDVQ